MWGFIIAIQCALALVVIWAVYRRRRGYWGGMYRVFSRLKTTPGQEQIIRTALVDLRDAAQKVRAETRQASPDLALLVQAESFDDGAARSWIASRERSFAELSPRILESMHRIHEVLDPEQRKILAGMLTRNRTSRCHRSERMQP